MTRLKVKDGDLIELRSRRGMLYAPAKANDAIAKQQAYVAMHWGKNSEWP